MRNMSFSVTERQYRDGTKSVTRRKGWLFLKRGDRFRAVRKAMGLKKGEKVEVLGINETVRVTRERIDTVTAADIVKEGFPGMCPHDFIEMICRITGLKPSDNITRIAFRRITDD